MIKQLPNINDYNSILEANNSLYLLLRNNKIKENELPKINTMLKLIDVQLKTLEHQRKYDIQNFDETKLIKLPIYIVDTTVDDE